MTYEQKELIEMTLAAISEMTEEGDCEGILLALEDIRKAVSR